MMCSLLEPAGLEPAGKADPLVLHLLVMAFHIVEADRQFELGRDQTADGGRDIELGDRGPCTAARLAVPASSCRGSRRPGPFPGAAASSIALATLDPPLAMRAPGPPRRFARAIGKQSGGARAGFD